jgi:DNA polymerase-3 subunit gamma/tau
MNLYNKYRPLSLLQVKGHDKILKDLIKRSKNNDFPQAMLFSGNTGTGKTTLHRIIAKNYLCQNKDKDGNSCNKCDQCISIDQEKQSMSYYEFNCSNIGVEEMRNIEELANTKVLSITKGKVIVLDELQELGKNSKAQKNILKILEKPLKNTLFILGTMDDSKIDKAVKNRCILYRLQDLDYKTILDYLGYVCDEEKIVLDSLDKANVLVAIANSSKGSMRTAIAILERVIYSEYWTVEEVQKELGIVTNDKMIQIVNGILSGDVTVFKNEINTDILERINYILNLYYKVLLGVEIEIWKKKELDGIIKVDIAILENIIKGLNELLKFTYNPYYLIEFVLLNSMNKKKQNEKSFIEHAVQAVVENGNEEKRRRRG